MCTLYPPQTHFVGFHRIYCCCIPFAHFNSQFIFMIPYVWFLYHMKEFEHSIFTNSPIHYKFLLRIFTQSTRDKCILSNSNFTAPSWTICWFLWFKIRIKLSFLEDIIITIINNIDNIKSLSPPKYHWCFHEVYFENSIFCFPVPHYCSSKIYLKKKTGNWIIL